MNHAAFFTAPRNREKSVLFWASALVESQRAQVSSNALTVLPPIDAVGSGSDPSDARQQRQDDDKEERCSSTQGPPSPTAGHAGHGMEMARAKRTRIEATTAACSQQEKTQQQQQQPEEENEKEGKRREEAMTSSTGMALPPPARHTLKRTSPHRFKDVLPISDALLQGLLGPVVIDVELNGSITLLRDHDAFVASLNAMEQASSDAVSNLHGAIQLFFLVCGESYYMLNASVLSPVMFLAKLLSAPAVRKIVLRAQQLYRLLFMFLGTDRVAVCNLVDVSVWSAVMGRVCGPHHHTKACTSASELWELIPDSARECIDLQLQNAEHAARYDPTVWCEGSDDDDQSSGERMKKTTTNAAAEAMAEAPKPGPSSRMVPLVQLTERLRPLAALYAYHDAYLRAVESSGATGDVSMPLASVCHLETRVNFLCEVMSYHGMFVDKRMLDRMVADLDQQVEAAVQKGNAVLHASENCIDGKIDMKTVAAKELVEFLSRRFVNLSLGEGNWVQKLQQLNEHMSMIGSADENLAHLWLGMHERREFRRSLLDSFLNGVNLHARVINVPGQAAAAAAVEEEDGGGGSAAAGGTTSVSAYRLLFTVHPQWSVHHSTTARIFCSRPNLQTLPKNPPPCRSFMPPADSSSAVATATLFSHPEWTVRHLYGPPPGCSLVSFDFNQIELRVLAHLSRDELLLQQLGSGRDVLTEMALRIIGLQRPEDVTPHMRQSTKVVVYGMVYGMGHAQLDQRMRQLRAKMSVESGPSAQELIRSFNQCYTGVYSFLKHTRLRAFHSKSCVTLNGVRDISSEPDGNRRKQMAMAMVIQGGAAVILHHAMVEVHERRHEFIPFFPASPLALVMSVHDELVYAVPDAAVGILAVKIKHILEQQAVALALRVPLLVSVKAGKTLGTLEPLPT